MNSKEQKIVHALRALKSPLLVAGLAALLGGCNIVKEALTPAGRDPTVAREMDGVWCSLGTSITWYNDHVGKRKDLTAGYQTRVMKVLKFTGFVNRGVNGGCVANQLGHVSKADYYTIEHGINDWGHSTPVGTLHDYQNNTANGTFCANYRLLVNEIRSINPKATIILCTPRRAYGFGDYLPAHWYLPKNGIKLEDYAKAIRAIAASEGFEVADFFKNSGHNENILKATSIDVALHPNDFGHELMAREVLRAFARVD